MRISIRRVAAAAAATTLLATGVLAAPAPTAAAGLQAAAAPSPFEDTSPYYEVSRGGAVWPLGGAAGYGDLSGDHLNAPVIGVTTTPDAQGYWLVAGDGGIFAFGDAGFHGSTGAMHLNRPIVGMTATPDGNGYWLFAGDGGIFAFGDAGFYGSTGAMHLNQPIVSMAATPDGRGYWLMGADGGVFSFGDAAYDGSLGGQPIGQSLQRIVAAPGGGYWEQAHDGDLHAFGPAAGQSPPVLAFVHTVESPGDSAVEWAMSKLGLPYLWGGTGPAAYDCSGLVMMAWGAAGVTIPRVAADQYVAGAKVPMSQLVAGDLVYWATDPTTPSTVEHVAMYLGGGHMVNAPRTGQVVQTNWIGGTGFMALGTHP